ncbi:MAG: hypothetical protein KDB65_13360 [Calditrichaeota bacterium]|nr:hypothetical protein [Calditrichota bacterium]
MKQPPEKIYLQWYGDGTFEEPEDIHPSEITWCQDKMYDADIEYVNASSHLSIAEIAAQRRVEPRDVFVEEIEKLGFVFKRETIWWLGDVGTAEILNAHAAIRYEAKNRFFLPYTAITTALIKAVYGGEK